jgi:mono/diheme cytochrome c family protein
MSVLSRALLLVVFCLLIVGGTIVGVAVRRVRRPYDVAPPPIARATAPDDVARGGRLFRTACLGCHAGPGGARPTGARVADAPAFIGEIWAPNITADPRAGIGAWTDGALARLLRNGLDRDGRYAAAMPRFSRIGDEDVAALIGFLRSNDPLIAPAPDAGSGPAVPPVPRSRLGIGGLLALAYAAGVDVSGEPHVPVPPRGPNADYGRYLASVIYGCVDCHTDGLGATPEKLRSPSLLAGGLALRTPHGDPIYSKNLTPDAETGLGRWTADDLTRALATGVGRGGRRLRSPMPIFRDLDGTDAGAIYAYLRSLPPAHSPTPGGS